MACFTVTVAEAIITTVAERVIRKKEKKENKDGVVRTDSSDGALRVKTPFSKKLRWLNVMLWGGSALLAFEHVWHGEVVPWFPFLTNAANPEDAAEMLREMATVGVGMALLVTAVWGVMVAVSYAIEKRGAEKTEKDSSSEEAQI